MSVIGTENTHVPLPYMNTLLLFVSWEERKGEEMGTVLGEVLCGLEKHTCSVKLGQKN